MYRTAQYTIATRNREPLRLEIGGPNLARNVRARRWPPPFRGGHEVLFRSGTGTGTVHQFTLRQNG